MAILRIEPQEEDIVYFVLPDLLPDCTLVYNPSLSTLNCLMNADSHPILQGQQQFTGSELALLLPLLRSFPHYAPYELLFTSYSYGIDGITDKRVEKARQHLYKAMDEGTWDREMRPLRNVMNRVRTKLRALQLDSICLLETGYIIFSVPMQEARKHP